MAASAISNLLRKNVGAGLARVSLNKNIIRNYFSLVFSVDKKAFKRRVWFDFNGCYHGRYTGYLHVLILWLLSWEIPMSKEEGP